MQTEWRVSLAAGIRPQFRDGLPVLGDDQDFPRRRHVVHQREALRLELRSLDCLHFSVKILWKTNLMTIVSVVVSVNERNVAAGGRGRLGSLPT